MLTLFRNDLRNGMGLDEALCKHNLSLKEAFDRMLNDVAYSKAHHFNPSYIERQGGRFYLSKTVNGIQTMFGVYSHHRDAVKVREMCKRYGWIQGNVNRYCRECGVERVKTKSRYEECYGE